MKGTLEKIEPADLKFNVFEQVGNDWMLITSGTQDKFNMMTASWGGMGVLWNKNVCFIFVRPTRYTFEFIEQNPLFTVSFFSENHREILELCGTKSGREIDKMKDIGLTPRFTQNGSILFNESLLSIECRKVYYNDLEPAHFITKDIDKHYPKNDYHRMYIGEIINCYRHL